MKFKLLSLLFALGLFAIGTNSAEAVTIFGKQVPGTGTTAAPKTGTATGSTTSGQGLCPAPFKTYTETQYVNAWYTLLGGICSATNSLSKDAALKMECQSFCNSVKAKTLPDAAGTSQCYTALQTAFSSPAPADTKIAKAIEMLKLAVPKIGQAGCVAMCTGIRPVIGGCNSCQFVKVRELCGRICHRMGGSALLGNCFVTNPDPANNQ